MSLIKVSLGGRRGRATGPFLLLSIFSYVAATSEGDGGPDAEIMLVGKSETRPSWSPLPSSPSSPSQPKWNDSSEGLNNPEGHGEEQEVYRPNGRRRGNTTGLEHGTANRSATRPHHVRKTSDHQEPSRKLRCACDSPDCLRNQKNFCITSGICYKQYLDRGEKAPHFIKGCTDDPTPLLCENRPPKPRNSHRWPYLECSVIHDVNMTKGKATGGRHEKGISQATTIRPDANWQRKQTGHNNRGSFPPISRLATCFLIGAACVIILVSSIGFYILRREQSLAEIYYRKDLNTASPEGMVEVGETEEIETIGRNEVQIENPPINNFIGIRLKNTNKVSSINQLEIDEEGTLSHLPSSHDLSTSSALFTHQ